MEDTLYSGFLTKSPPEHKINRARWQRRWFVLKRNPSAVYLQYYKDQNSTRPKGTIDLNSCEQVDQGLTFESRRSLAKAFIFDVVTPKRKYYLVSNTEDDMIRWVRNICLACGFQLEGQDEDPAAEPNVPTQPVNIVQSTRNVHGSQTHAVSAPGVPTEGAEPYIQLDECETGENNDHSQSAPANGCLDNQEEVFPMDPNRRSHTGSSGSNSSIPSVTAPLPPPSQIEPATMEIYDIPPALQRPSSADVQPTYDIPPAHLKRDTLFQNQDDIYNTVPTPRLVDISSSNTSSIMPDGHPSSIMPDGQNQLNGDVHDLYAVPPSHNSDRLYDFPPVHPLMRNKNNEMSSSTDKLAQDFQQISVRNSRGASDDGSMDLYSVPPSSLKNATDLFNSPDDGSPRNITPPPRPPKVDPTAAANNASQPMSTPPRPPKPPHLRPSTPPPSFDEAYDILPGQSRPIPSQDLMGRVQQVPIYAVPPGPSTNRNDIRSPPNGHQWLDSKVPTPLATDTRYINTRQSSARVLDPATAGYLHQRVVPPPHSQRASMFESDIRYSPGPTGQQQSYLPMIGTSDSSSVFQYPDNSLYMAMEGTNNGSLRPDGRLPSDAERNTYALMSGTAGFPVSRPLPSNFHRQTFSGGARPPPIDRSSKPDRKASEGAIRSTDHIGMSGSYYASSDDILRPVHDLRPIQSDRTRSYSKPPGQYENQILDPDFDPFRHRSNTGGSTTSSSDDDMYSTGDSDFYTFSRSVPPVPEEDTYIYKDVPAMGVLPERPMTEALSSMPIMASHPSQQKDDIEYLELSHDHHDEEPCQPPPRPPKPSSPKVEYIDLDLQRMLALKQVTERREEEKDGGVSGRGTLTRRDP